MNYYHSKTIDSKDLVVGDVYIIEQGMRIPADSLLIEGKNVSINQSELTGESDTVERSVLNNQNQ